MHQLLVEPAQDHLLMNHLVVSIGSKAVAWTTLAMCTSEIALQSASLCKQWTCFFSDAGDKLEVIQLVSSVSGPFTKLEVVGSVLARKCCLSDLLLRSQRATSTADLAHDPRCSAWRRRNRRLRSFWRHEQQAVRVAVAAVFTTSMTNAATRS